MAENKSSISKKSGYIEIGEYWDSHELSEATPNGDEVAFDVELQSDIHYYAVEDSISSKLNKIAKKQGVSTEKLVNVWLNERADREVVKR